MQQVALQVMPAPHVHHLPMQALPNCLMLHFAHAELFEQSGQLAQAKEVRGAGGLNCSAARCVLPAIILPCLQQSNGNQTGRDPQQECCMPGPQQSTAAFIQQAGASC